MMNERETDMLLSDLFKRNAPYVDEAALCERIDDRLPRRRRRRRRVRTARTVAVVFASVVLAGGVAYGAYETVTYLQGRPALVITDSIPPAGGTATSGTGAATSVAAGLVPVMGTATLEQVKNEGVTSPAIDINYTTQISGRVLVYELDMSQSGISGTLEITADFGVRADGSAEIQGSWVLSNDQGTWKCASWEGVVTADGLEQFSFGVALGFGGYDGLGLYLLWHSTQVSGSTTPAAVPPATSGSITGWIQSAD